MHRPSTLSLIALFAGVALVTPQAAMAATSSFEVRITAHVDPFCRINLDQSQTEKQLDIVNGSAQIGVVHEICNTAGGYDVTAMFTNLSGGELSVAGQNYPIDDSGNSVRRSNIPMMQNANWLLSDAHVVGQNMPVVMRLTISPR